MHLRRQALLHFLSIIAICCERVSAQQAAEETRYNAEQETKYVAPPSLIKYFESCKAEIGSPENPIEVAYRLYSPQNAAKQNEGPQSYPLLVWLHGYGEAGQDNSAQLRWLDWVYDAETAERQFPGFVLVYQCPADFPMWDSGPLDDQPLTVVRQIVDCLLQSHPIDTNRVYLSGVSSGGTGCWEMLLRYPDLFSAAAPLASAGTKSKSLQPLVDIPIWAFHVLRDPESPVQAVRATVSRLQEIGGNARLTETAGYEHNCWSSAFRDYRVIDWLLTQRKGAIGPAPGSFGPGMFQVAWQSLQSIGVAYYLPVPVVALIGYLMVRKSSALRTEQ